MTHFHRISRYKCERFTSTDVYSRRNAKSTHLKVKFLDVSFNMSSGLSFDISSPEMMKTQVEYNRKNALRIMLAVSVKEN